MTHSFSSEEERVFFQEAFSRNKGLLTEAEQERLRQSTVAVAGLGGVGGIEAVGLARLGVGHFHLSDPDTFEVANFNRQAGAMMSTVGKQKAEVIMAMIHDINPFAQVKVWNTALDETSVGPFLDGADIVVDGIDFFAPKARRLLYHAAREKGLFVVGAGPIGFGSALLVFDPKGMDFDTYFDIHDGMSEKDMTIYYGLGVTPSLLQRSYFRPEKIDFDKKSGASLSIGTFFAAGFVLTNVAKVLLGHPVSCAPASMHFDPYVEKLKRPWLLWGNRGLLQRIKIAVALFQIRKHEQDR
ncbi:MAG: ThiF family adenylyltransferase [Candidatus Moranbacteria bacterium]|jgi:molybdopterin/thiamine biosynthesis adenylyltransferase|nr:ThiF family adenylyltransferase [Candidatus Moranbacteria bacterium]